MKLSMYMIADCLKEYRPRAFIQSDGFGIESVRLFTDNFSLCPGTLYVGKASDFFEYEEDYVICAHDNNIITADCGSLEEVFNCILNAIEYYSDWNSRLLRLLTQGAAQQDLFDATADMLRVPAFLLDAGQRLLAYTKNFPEGSVDYVWDQMLSGGSASVDILMDLNARHPERFSEKELYFDRTEVFPHDSFHQNFFLQEKWIGSASLIFLEEYRVQSIHHRSLLDLFSLFCEYIRQWFEIHAEEQQSILLDNLLRTAMTVEHYDGGDLRRQLFLQGWREEDPCILLKLDASGQPYSINPHLCRTLNMQFPNCYAITSEFSICMVCNLRLQDEEGLFQQLAPLLETNRYYGTVSRRFTQQDLYRQYQFVKTISAFCGKKPGEIYDGNGCMMPYLLSEMQKTVLPEICHPALFALRRYDEKHHTDFYDTLYYYLKNERSPLATAREMGLHRNSLAYRLNRLPELTGADLDDYRTRLHLLLSYELFGRGERPLGA